MTIGERIKKRREEIGISQEDLAIKLGYKNRSSINKIEQDKQNLRQTKIKAIADALDTTPAYIMGWTEPIFTKTEINFTNELYTAVAENKKHAWLDANEQDIIKSYRNFDEESKRQLILMLAFLKDQQNKK